MKKAIGIYSITLGISIIGLWVFILMKGDMKEGPFESTFHLISEFLMATLCILGGLQALSQQKAIPLPLLTIAHAMVIYSVLNAAGYYAETSGIIMALPFIILCTISAITLKKLPT